EARRRLALAQVRQYPDPVLRMKANDVEAFDEDLSRLIERLSSLLKDANGLGLAATQIGVLRRVFVFQPDPEEPAVALVNPRAAGGGRSARRRRSAPTCASGWRRSTRSRTCSRGRIALGAEAAAAARRRRRRPLSGSSSKCTSPSGLARTSIPARTWSSSLPTAC